MVYDLQVSRILDVDSDGQVDIVYYSPAGRNPLSASDDANGDITNFGGTWGGVFEVYADSTPDLDETLQAGSGPDAWAAGGGPLRPNGLTNADGYPSATDGILWVSGVFLDLSLFGDPLAQSGEVYRVTATGGDCYAGVGFLNVFDGAAAPYIQPGTQPPLGPGAYRADVTLQVTYMEGVNVWDNDAWAYGSSDPLYFCVCPEPTTLLSLTVGALVLGGLRRRK